MTKQTISITRGLSVALAGILIGGSLPAIGTESVTAAELPDTVFAAAYLGADALDETSLPATVSDGETEHAVAWTFDATTFAHAYDTVEVQGVADGQPITAHVEVLAPATNPLAYFVDAGHNGDSQSTPYSNLLTESRAFTAATTLAAPLNALPDQRYADGWGWISDATNNVKISVTGGDPNPADAETLGSYGKYELGVRTNGTAISYRLTLDPGVYTLSSGFFEFYTGNQNRSRGILPTVSYTLNGATQSVTLERALLNTPANTEGRLLVTDVFTIPEGATDVRLSYVKESGEAPVLSWFAIAAGDAEEAIDGPAPEEPPVGTAITVDAATIAADNLNGLTFKGFGVLSANSTSAVLMDYKAQHPEAYAELLQVLFGGEHPIMNHVKIEMGNDRNNSTGSDVATMRWETEPANVTRHPGFQLAADALKLNPNLRVSILRWNAPAWANTNDKIYTWYKNTILAAYREYGYMVDYVNPGVNEHSADLAWTKDYAQRVATDTTGYVSSDPALAGFREGEAELYHQIQVVISDEVGTGTFGDEMVADAELREVVGASGFHYNTNDDAARNFTRLAEEFDEEIWNSEAQATFSNSAFRPNNNVADPTVPGTGLGGTGSSLEMANTVIKGFVMSRRTHFIYQPAIGSFFEGGQYSFKELVSARDPWSGWMHYDAGLAVLQHFSSFAVTGWENEDNTNGIWRVMPSASASTATGTNPVVGRNGLPNYLTLAAPDASDFSTVIVNDSELPQTYRIKPVGFDLGASATLALWQTKAADEGELFNADYKQLIGDVAVNARGEYVVTVAPFSIATVTSLDATTDESWTTPLPVEGERTVLDADPEAGTLWADDFDYSELSVPVIAEGGGLSGETEDFLASRGGDAGAIAMYKWDRNGAFEAYRTDDAGYVLRQQVDRAATGVGGAWNGGDPITAIGDRRWTNYTAGVDVRFERAPAADNYAAIGVRSSGGGGSHNLNGTAYALKVGSNGAWQLLRMGAVVTSGGAAESWDAAAWHRLELTAAGATLTGSIDGVEVFSWTDSNAFLSGWVDLASGFHRTQFDNVTVERVQRYLPYYGEYLDGLEMHDLEDAQKLVYDGSWRHTNGGGMFEYQRSSSRNLATGAGVSYTFVGSGLDVIGGDGTARLNVYVDGQLIAANAPTQPAAQFQKTYSLRGLPWGQHTVRLEVASGTINVDAVAVASVPALKPAGVHDLEAAVAAARAIERTDDFTDAAWALLQNAIQAAEAAVADPAGYRLDGEGAVQLVARLTAASFPLAARITSLPTVWSATTVDRAPDALPATLTATLDDGTTREVPIAWQLETVDVSRPWTTVTVTGSYGSAVATARVEVAPHGVVAFADVNATSASSLGYDSPSYGAISRLLEGALVNATPDQVLQGDRAWGHWGENRSGVRDIQYKGIVAGPYDKTTTTGLYTANQIGASVGYTLSLPAGRYTLTAASHSWWPSSSRTADVVLTYDGVEHKVDTITLNTSTPSRTLSYDLTLAADGPVTLELRATNAQSPMLSWVAAVRAPYTVEVDLNGGVGSVQEPRSVLWTDAGLVPTGDEPVRNGHTFAGWGTEPGGDGVLATPASSYAELAEGDRDAMKVTLYAQWTPQSAPWRSDTVYIAGEQVMHNGGIFVAQWWTRGEVPGTSTRGAWAQLGDYVLCSTGIEREWTPSWVYTGGEMVEHDGTIWQAQWWTRSQEPTPKPWGPWKAVATC